MKKQTLFKALALSGLLLTQTSFASAQEAYTVKLQKVDQYKAVFATVESVDVVMARSRIGGTVKELVIDEGVAVFAGDVVAVVEDPKLKLELAAVDARIQSLKSQKKLAEIDLQRATKLRKTGAGSQARLDEAQTNVDVVDKNLKAMLAERDVTLQRLSEGKVLAPATGRVLKVNVTNGVVVMPGEAIGSIARETYRLRMHLPERHARFLKAGEKVKVGQRGSKSTLAEGTVRQVYPQLENGRVVADVEVKGLGDFFVGERTPVYVPTGSHDVLMVPKEFVFKKFGLSFVTIQGEGEVVVEPAGAMGDHVEILSGLSEGDILSAPKNTNQ